MRFCGYAARGAKKAGILTLLPTIGNAQFEQIAQKIAKRSLRQNFE
jgi:hypothetical protein